MKTSSYVIIGSLLVISILAVFLYFQGASQDSTMSASPTLAPIESPTPMSTDTPAVTPSETPSPSTTPTRSVTPQTTPTTEPTP